MRGDEWSFKNYGSRSSNVHLSVRAVRGLSSHDGDVESTVRTITKQNLGYSDKIEIEI